MKSMPRAEDLGGEGPEVKPAKVQDGIEKVALGHVLELF